MLIPGHRHYLYLSTRVPALGLSNARIASASGPVAPVIFNYLMFMHLLFILVFLKFQQKRQLIAQLI